MNNAFLGNPPAAIENWLKSQYPNPPPTPTKGGIWVDLGSQSIFKYYSEDNAVRYWDITESPGQTYITYESGKGWTYQYITVKSDVIAGTGSEKQLDFVFTDSQPRSCKWYESATDIPTWILKGSWSIDGVARSTAITDNNEYTLWGNDSYHVKWNKLTNTWSGKRNGRTMYNISTTLANARTFTYTISTGGSYTATWSAS